MAERETIVLIGSDPGYLVNFRIEFLELLSLSGYRVVTVAWPGPAAISERLRALGVARHVEAPIKQGSLNPIHELRLILSIWKLIRQERPSTVIAYTAKPVLSGMVAARLAGVGRRVALIEGLGYAFIAGPGAKRRIAALMLGAAYRLALRAASTIVVLNSEDQRDIARLAGKNPSSIGVLKGIGVSRSYFRRSPLPAGPRRFIFVGRILIDKGLRELLEAAKILRQRGLAFELTVVGSYDRNPAAVPEAEFKRALEGAGAKWVGHSAQVPDLIAQSHVLVLPSYREGFPRVVMEAMAAGRPAIVTDVAGCRDAIEDSVNGLIVPARDPVALASAMARLVEDSELVAQMSDRAFEAATRDFQADDRAKDLSVLAGVGAPALH